VYSYIRYKKQHSPHSPPHLTGRPGPSSNAYKRYSVPWAYESLHSKQDVDLFSRFCKAQARDGLFDTPRGHWSQYAASPSDYILDYMFRLYIIYRLYLSHLYPRQNGVICADRNCSLTHSLSVNITIRKELSNSAVIFI